MPAHRETPPGTSAPFSCKTTTQIERVSLGLVFKKNQWSEFAYTIVKTNIIQKFQILNAATLEPNSSSFYKLQLSN